MIITIEILVKTITWFSYFILVGYMAIKTTRNYLTIKHEEENKHDNIRLIIAVYFIFFFSAIFGDFILWINNIETTIEPVILTNYEIMGWSTICIGFLITTQLTLMFYTYKREELYFSAYFFYIGMVIYFLLTGFQGLHSIYIQISGTICNGFLIYYGIRYKANQVLGLGVLSILAFISTFFYNAPIIWSIIAIIISIYGILYAKGKIIFFKEKNLNGGNI